MLNPEQFYQSKIKEYTAQLHALKSKSLTVSVMRLAIFLVLAFCIYRIFKTELWQPWFFASILAAVSFILMVRFSVALAARKNLSAKLLFINQNELNILNGKLNAFDEDADNAGERMHTSDLDIFGKNSLYHLLNRTTTIYGEQSLIHALNYPLLSKNDIVAHQQAIRILAGQPEKRQLITAYGLLNENKTGTKEIADWIGTPEKILTSRSMAILRFALPALTIAGILIYLDSNNPILFGIAFLLSWLVIGNNSKYTNYQHQLIGKKEETLRQYGTILKAFSKTNNDGSVILHRLTAVSESAVTQLLQLSKLSTFFDQRLNLLVGFFLNSIVLYDIQVMIELEKWKKKNRQRFDEWMNTMGEIEKLNSFASFHFNHPEYCLPAVEEQAPFVSATALGHPLIPAAKQVVNDITAGISEKLLLVTGSNMSGKSTFLRTVGVNLLLAQCGLPVCAGTFSFSPMQLLSSIRISDSLQENTSYFMAELKRLKQIINDAKNGQPSLVLIDEVLRGTNSDDKTYGSEELIRKLCSFNCLSVFATHDLSLSVLETALPGRVKNYCFESTIVNDELFFNYKLHTGVATNKNASFLMKKMGIIS